MPGRVVVLGGGATGEAFLAALRRLDAEAPVTLVEHELVGGECTYWACMPSKTLLRPVEVVTSARIAPGAAEAVSGTIDPERLFAWRDQIVSDHEDSGHAQWLTERNIELVRGRGEVVEPGLLRVGDKELEYEKLVVATGSVPRIPEIEGLAGSGYWTSREATSASEVPASVVVLGGGTVGCELAQFFRRLGSEVTIVHSTEHLLPRDDPEAGQLLQRLFEEEGIVVRCEAHTVRVEPGFRLHLEDGATVDGERLLVATGRRANTRGFGFEKLGLRITERGIEVDERLRAGENVWAIGDVTGVALFTHLGKYQGRLAAHDIAGREIRADYRAVPASTFTDPQVASVGTHEDGLVVAKWAIERTSRSSTYERPKRPGFLKLFADPERRVLVGAVAVGPEAGEWLGQLTLAIRAEVSIDVLRDTIQPFPTFSEAVFFAARELDL